MEQRKIQKAAQLADDMKKVKRAIGLMSAAENGNVNVRLSSGSAENSDDISFAYLPKRLLPEISKMLLWAESEIQQGMEDL